MGKTKQPDDGVRMFIRVTPNAPRTEIMGTLGEYLKLRLAAPNVDGKANQALIAWLSDELGVAKSQIKITQGKTNKNKSLYITCHSALQHTACLRWYDTCHQSAANLDE